ncbi:hypothetical protein ACFE04_025510 [Oxalis oulophora]
MELASSSSLSIRTPAASSFSTIIISRNDLLNFNSNSLQFSPKFPGCRFRVLKISSLCAVIGDKAESVALSNETLESEDGLLDDQNMCRVCDKLIDVFMVDKPTPNEWRKLLAFSREWDTLRPHFYNRCQHRADTVHDPGMKHKLLRFARKHKQIDEDLQRHNELIKLVKESPSLDEFVARRRKDFTEEFFVHLYTVVESYYDKPTEQNALAKLGEICATAVQAYDSANESIEAINVAQLKLQDIVNSPSLDAACRKIDDLAAKNQLDSTLMLMITKAWSGAKESNMTKDEVKDILYHLYVKARGNLQRLVPKEIRILKHLLMIEDHDELMCNLKDAFTPGQDLEGDNEDCLFTTPEKVHASMQMVLDAYHYSQEGTLIREARDLMNPRVIHKIEELKKLVEKNFM